MRGTVDEPLQLVESYFAGRRKYNRGRLRAGDKKPRGDEESQTEHIIKMAQWGSVDPSSGEDELERRPTFRTNYGKRVVGPWVLGVYKSCSEFRFFIIPDRKALTLREVIRGCCDTGSVIMTDEWSGYSKLSEDGFIHRTVKHSKWFLNPSDGTNTQEIERLWVEGKAILKRHRRPNYLLQSHLDELAWRKRHRNCSESLISRFWRDVHRVHGLSLNELM